MYLVVYASIDGDQELYEKHYCHNFSNIVNTRFVECLRVVVLAGASNHEVTLNLRCQRSHLLYG